MESKEQTNQQEAMEKHFLRLHHAFPLRSADFFITLWQRIVSHGFTADELENAVNHVIDTCDYDSFAVSSIIQHKK
ncbi:hypothetical protein Barb6_00990 [Bacteroidales bacterium Barb6]|nr:hypothetical protein Barb6_00990 [Bacteroidales bacterium Barb6]